MTKRTELIAGTFLVALAAVALVGCGDDTLVQIPPPPDPPQQEDPPPVEDPPPSDPAPPATSGSACDDDSQCGDGSECASGTCVGTGVLQVTLTFPVDADYDLHVLTPNGDEIYFANVTADGGVLDVDQCISSCGPGEHVENIFFNGALLSGEYEAWAVNYDGRDGGSFRIDVSGQTTAEIEGELPAFPDDESDPLLFTVP